MAKIGRPTKYHPSLCDKVNEYLSTTGTHQGELPSRYKLAQFIGVDEDTVVEWCKSYPEFSVACKRIDQAQRQQLIDDGMYGGKEVNTAMAIFLLKANHGMIETQRTELTGKGGEPFRLNLIAYGANIPGSQQFIDASEGSPILPGEIQSPSLASPSKEDSDSTDQDSH